MEKSLDISKNEFILSNISWSLNETRNALTISSFNNIPKEIIIEIFQYLSVHDLCNISLVCRSFKMIADHDEIWKSKIIKSIKLYSKSYKQIYIEWIHIKKFQYENLTSSNWSSLRKNACIGSYLDPLFPVRPEGKHNFVRIHGFDQHPNSTQEMTINLSVDIDKIVRQLISLIGKASYSQRKWQHSHILKQMIQRYYRFMQLKAFHSANLFLIPTLDIEIIWQTHLLRPKNYHNDCLRLFHRIIDHSLIINHIQQIYKDQAFLDTCQLYEEKFGEKYYSFVSIEEENEIKLKSSLTQDELLHHYGPMYSYYDKMYEFSSNLSNNYENPFSFTENDIISDIKWFHFYDEFMYNAMEKVSIQNNISLSLTTIDLGSEPMKRLKKSYERFLYMAAKYSFKDENQFLPHTYAIDLIWHSHLQEPLNYISDCIRFVGYIIFHDPSPYLENKSSDGVDQIWKNEFQCDIDTDHLYSTSDNKND